MVTTRTVRLSRAIVSKFHTPMATCRDLMQRAEFFSRRAYVCAVLLGLIVLASIPQSISRTSMGIKSDKTFEDIVERMVALVSPPPADDDAKVDTHERPASNQSEEKDGQPSSKTPFVQKKR
jgi:hypothetical protein